MLYIYTAPPSSLAIDPRAKLQPTQCAIRPPRFQASYWHLCQIATRSICIYTAANVDLQAKRQPAPAVSSSSLALFNKPSTTPVSHSSVPRSLIFHSLEQNSPEEFEINGLKFWSVKEIFGYTNYINQQPAENRWALTENLLNYWNTVVRQFEKWNEQILEETKREKAWSLWTSIQCFGGIRRYLRHSESLVLGIIRVRT